MSDAITKADVLQFLRSQSLAVQTSVSSSGKPQAALVGFIVTDDFEVFFDTLESSRKATNLRTNPNTAFVIGGLASHDERTVQLEGVADVPNGGELERLKELYFARFPDGRERLAWPGLIYLRARPSWLRFSDFNRAPPVVVEFRF